MEYDIISALPDPLIVHILSYLPISDSIKTSILSWRWKNLCLKVSVFDLTTVRSSLFRKALMRIVSRFMKLNGSSYLQNFNIKYRKENYEISFFDFFQEKKMIKYCDTIDCNKRVVLIAELIICGLQHLDVDMCLNAKHHISNFVYVSKTLVSLKLVNVKLEYPMFCASLPSLKIIHLENIYSETTFCGLVIIEKLISASPLLEDLTYDCISNPLNPWYPNINKVPQCLKSTLKYVKINKLMMEEKSGISQVNYILENSAVLEKLTLSFKQTSEEKQEPESYMKLLTSKKLSPTCQVFFS